VLRREAADLNCPHVRNGCSGCTVHRDLDKPPALDRAKSFLSKRDIHLFSTFLIAHGWRCRARLAVRAASSGPVVGLFKPGSHEVHPLLDCPLHHPRINQAISEVCSYIKEWKVTPYAETPLPKRCKRTPSLSHSSGLLRYLQLTTCSLGTRSQEHPNAPVQLVCVVNCSKSDNDATAAIQGMLASLFEAHGPSSATALFHSIWLNFQSSPGNCILGNEWRRMHGPKWIWHRYSKSNAQVALSPGSFVQVCSDRLHCVMCSLCECLQSSDATEHSRLAKVTEPVLKHLQKLST
jgi:23S rRNA (uracil1939-C5)-methyltransferase